MRRFWIAAAAVAAMLALSGIVSATAPAALIKPTALTAHTTPNPAFEICLSGTPPCGRVGYEFHTTGKLFLGDENYMVACSGDIVVEFSHEAHGNKLVQLSRQVVPLRPDCTYAVTTHIPDVLHSGTFVFVHVRFVGNAVIAPIKAPNQSIQVFSRFAP